VYADIENLTTDVVTIRSPETMLVVQPEVAFPIACVALEKGIFPAQPFSSTASDGSKIDIQPSEHYKVFWNLTNAPAKDSQPPTPKEAPPAQGRCSESSWRRTVREYLGFVPGDYAFTVEGIVYVPSQKPETPTTAHTYTETTTLHVGLSQASTAIAAFMGALLAYLVVAIQPGKDFDKWKASSAPAPPPPGGGGRGGGGPEDPKGGPPKAQSRSWLHNLGVIVRNAFAAGLLGSALTIVASRLSDTQFPVKVSVNDFWGALTIGFISYFIGNNLLTSILQKYAPGSPSPRSGNKATGGPEVQSSGGPPPRTRPAPESKNPAQEEEEKDIETVPATEKVFEAVDVPDVVRAGWR
jgi:hypothetical protein